MRLLTRFGAGSRLYTFNGEIVDYDDNFAELENKVTAMPFADGGFRQLGDARGSSKLGMVTASYWLHFDDQNDAFSKINAFRQMQDYGMQRLFMQPETLSAGEWWCWAAVKDVEVPRNIKNLPHKRIKVKAVFEVPDPFWYSASGLLVWGGGAKWGEGATAKWGGGTPTTYTGVSNAITLTNNGNAYTLPQFAIRPDTGQTCADPVIRRIVDGAVVDEVRFYGVLGVGDNLMIDCRKKTIRLNDVDQYTNSFRAATPDWMRLLPGSNSIELRFAQSTDAAKVNIKFPTRYV